MEHLENMESELHAKQSIAQVGEQQLKELQEQFLEFRTEKRQKEQDLKQSLEKLRFENENLKREKDLEIQHAKLVAETERLNLKSEYDVKTEILQRESAFLQEERKKLKQEMKELIQNYEIDFKALKQEGEGLKNELLLVKREEVDKEQTFEELQLLKTQLL